MAKSKVTFSKKEKEKRKLQRRKEKEKRREDRKANASKSFEDMIAYTDEYGNIISEPPDPDNKEEINEGDILIGARNKGSENKINPIRNGEVTFYNEGKGYGFIKDLMSKKSIFVHQDSLMNPIKEHDKVTFETAKGPKGPIAIKVTLAE
ncbi:MAG: cold shock domain-containing protein [Cytophagales bacterium]|nr:cold shock domain-containing protein [Cytophagales bacterium]